MGFFDDLKEDWRNSELRKTVKEIGSDIKISWNESETKQKWKNSELKKKLDTVTMGKKSFQEALVLVKEKKFNKALSKINILLETSKPTWKRLFLKSVILSNLNRNEEAIYIGEEALKLNKNKIELIAWMTELHKIAGNEKAGLAYEKIENYSKAGLMYEKARMYEKSANCYLKAEDKEKAADSFLKAGVLKKAVQLYRQLKKYDKSAQILEKQNKVEEAAIDYEKAQKYDLSGQNYRKVENWAKAGLMYEKAKNYLEASRMYARCQMYKKADEMEDLAKKNIKRKPIKPSEELVCSICRQKISTRDISRGLISKCQSCGAIMHAECIEGIDNKCPTYGCSSTTFKKVLL